MCSDLLSIGLNVVSGCSFLVESPFSYLTFAQACPCLSLFFSATCLPTELVYSPVSDCVSPARAALTAFDHWTALDDSLVAVGMGYLWVDE